MATFRRLNPFEAAIAWPMAEPYLQKALDQDEHTLLTTQDLRANVMATRMNLWIVEDEAPSMPKPDASAVFKSESLIGAFVTEIVHGGKGAALNIIALGGDKMPQWIEKFSENVTLFARAYRCRYVVEMGRRGWNRVLAPFGWKDVSSVMLKVV